jgi:hypothetical protein
MAELYFYSVMTAVPSGTIRFGWVSATTGITYCGICLRSPVAPQVGKNAKHAARVSRSSWTSERKATRGDRPGEPPPQCCGTPITCRLRDV